MLTLNALARTPAIFTLAALIAAAPGTSRFGGKTVSASNPCDQASHAPGQPGDDPEPGILGYVIDANSNSPVQSATVSLYRCDGTQSVYLSSDSTDANGGFDFGSLEGPTWYYVLVDPIGPLAGMEPALGTANPSGLVDVGPGTDDLTMDFQ